MPDGPEAAGGRRQPIATVLRRFSSQRDSFPRDRASHGPGELQSASPYATSSGGLVRCGPFDAINDQHRRLNSSRVEL